MTNRLLKTFVILLAVCGSPIKRRKSQTNEH